MGDVANKVGSFIGDVTGFNAQQRADDAAESADTRLGKAAKYNEDSGNDIAGALAANKSEAERYDAGADASFGANAGESLDKATQAASKQSLNAANLAAGSAAAGARAAGLNPGQAALVASQGADQAYQSQLNQGINQYGQAANTFAAQANAKRGLQNENINQGLQRAGQEASIATGSTGLANQQQQTANQQGGTVLSGLSQVLNLSSDETQKDAVKDLSRGIDTGGYGYAVPKFGDGGLGKKIQSMLSGSGGNPVQGAELGGDANVAVGGDAAGAATAGIPEAATALAALSDRNVKTDMAPASMKDVLNSLLSNVKPVSYVYKNGIETGQSGKPDGTMRVGILAQDLEKTPLHDTVIDTPEGKKLDVPQLTANNTALILELARQIVGQDNRIKELEANRG